MKQRPLSQTAVPFALTPPLRLTSEFWCNGDRKAR
jgi:hypothetical protein